jgi:amino acid transporter
VVFGWTVQLMASPASTPLQGKPTMSLWSVSALGIGSMVGAGIFALLGQAALVAGKEVYLAFLIGGVAALLSGYSYAKLAARYPTAGGIMDYFNAAFPSRVAAGALSIIYVVTLIVTIAMIAKTFGAYGNRLIFGDGSPKIIADLFASGVVVALVLVNMAGGEAVGRAELVLVGIKLTILVVLMLAGLPTVDPALLAGGESVAFSTLLASVGLTFFAYAGYGMMANAAGSVANPAKTIPRAIFLAIGVVILLYVGLAVVVLGNVSAAELSRFADTAVAQAAKPVLGHFGFVIVSIGALLATASAINATLFSALAISRGLAKEGQLPALFAAPFWREGTQGLVWAAGAILIMVNLLDLGAIAHIAGATFLICYLAVFVAHWRLRPQAGGSSVLILLGFALMVVVLVAFLASLWQTQPTGIALTVLFVAGSAGVAWLVRRRGAGAAGEARR